MGAMAEHQVCPRIDDRVSELPDVAAVLAIELLIILGHVRCGGTLGTTVERDDDEIVGAVHIGHNFLRHLDVLDAIDPTTGGKGDHRHLQALGLP